MQKLHEFIIMADTLTLRVDTPNLNIEYLTWILFS